MSLLQPSPSSTGEQEIIDFSYERPLGVSILAVLLFIIGAVSFIMDLMYSSRFVPMTDLLGTTKALVMAVFYFLAALGIASSIGMWFGKSWGWWLAMFFFAYGILRNGYAMLSIPELAALMEAGEAAETTGFYLKHGVKVMGEAGIMLYLLRPNPLIFFCKPDTAGFKLRAVGQVFGAGLLVIIVFGYLQVKP